MRRPGGLGRGLDALIPGANGGLSEVPVESISPGPHQPRMTIDEASLQELAASVREHGVLQPLIVTEAPAGSGRYVLVAGERRWRAALVAGLKTVPAVVKNADGRSRLEMALVENLQRADLNALEEANAYRQLVDEFGMTQEQVAQRVGRSRVTVTNALRLLRLPDPVKQRLCAGQITEGHARALLALPRADAQARAAEQIVERDLSVRETEALVRRLNEPAAREEREPARPRDEALEAAATQIEQVLGTKVEIVRSRRGGRIVIYFYDDEELNGLFQYLTRPRTD